MNEIDDSLTSQERYELFLAEEIARQRARRDARRIIGREERLGHDLDVAMLAEVLQRPPEAPYRVEGLIPSDAGTLLVAQRKTGKSTWALNLARSLILGKKFLGTLDVIPVVGNVAALNFEVSSRTYATWAREVGIPGDRLVVANLRGGRNPLSDPEDGAALAEYLRAHDVETVIVDPFGRAYDGASQNDAGEVGKWLLGLDRWARSDVGARDVILTAHAGWNGERSRGSSALEDWADTIVTLTRGEVEDGPRYMRAVGRDVDMPEDELYFDPGTRRLTLTGSGGRAQASAERRAVDKAPEVLQFITDNPGASKNDVEKMGGRKSDLTAALKALVADGAVESRKREGRGGGLAYFITANLPQHPPTSPGGTLETSPILPYRGEVLGGKLEVEPPPTPEEWTDPRWGQCVMPEKGDKPVILNPAKYSAWRLAGQPTIEIPEVA
ncbi:AAA family ATPase [Actinomyces provencensis]|uniref:AAA family ATPase n=1 Tax=Actinomyces provencensis TaxID=1720198 RepID=UPI00096A9D4F|nr:AAA family ATPase [Actinomyces provencensis]